MTAITTIILGLGVVIAYFQWRTAHQRVVLDLFERRMDVFEDIENAAKQSVNSADRDEANQAYWTFVSAEANARFLFGTDVLDKLETLRADLAAIKAFIAISQKHHEYEAMKNRENLARHNLVSFLENSSELFAPYMRLDQKMPSLWWPC